MLDVSNGCVPIGDCLLEGYVDLLYRRPGAGLVVVDYKTASTTAPADLDQRVEGYRRQNAAYALAVGEATGEPVEEVVFVFPRARRRHRTEAGAPRRCRGRGTAHGRSRIRGDAP